MPFSGRFLKCDFRRGKLQADLIENRRNHFQRFSNLVAGTVYGVDANNKHITTSHWVYIPGKQGAGMMERIGILEQNLLKLARYH